MANRTISGGPVEGLVATFAPAAAWTDPAAGDLVKQSATGSYLVAECGDGDIPLGAVRQVSQDSRVLSVEVFTSGTIARVAYTGTPSLGQQVQASAATTVKGVASGGAGVIVGKDVESGKVDILFT